MARKPVTYARRRTRNKHKLTLSSPAQTLDDGGMHLMRSEMTRRMLKRSHHSGNFDSADSTLSSVGQKYKRARLSIDDIPELARNTEVSSDEALHAPRTPFPSHLSQEQIFRLKSSKGSGSDQSFSPIPMAVSHLYSALRRSNSPDAQQDIAPKPIPSHKTRSSSLKENSYATLSSNSNRKFTKDTGFDSSATAVTRSRLLNASSTTLASPFTSRPSSPHRMVECESLKTTIRNPLMDKRFDPNIPSDRLKAQTLSTANSPVQRPSLHDSIRERRPSAPSTTAPRPNIIPWFKSGATSNDLSKRGLFDDTHPRTASVDFNRPPSQLSCNFSYDEAFFCDALQISTPSGRRTQRPVSMDWSYFGSPDSTDEKDDNQTKQRSSDMQITYPLSLTPEIFGSWISDSLISPPSPSCRRAYKRQKQLGNETQTRDSIVDDTLGHEDLSDSRRGVALTSNLERHSAVEEREEILQELFDSLKLESAQKSSGLPLPRTRSLGSELDRPRDRQSLRPPVEIPPLEAKQSPLETVGKKSNGRDRSGTIRASDFQVPQRSSGAAGPRRTRSGTVVQGVVFHRRERSGTITARPPSTLVTQPVDQGDIGMQGPRGTDRPRESDDVLMSLEGSDDELLLQNKWFIEDQTKTESLSLKVSRRGGQKDLTKRVNRRKKSYRSGQASTIPNLEELITEDDDDPLLLK